MICGSVAWQTTEEIVEVCAARVWMFTLVRMSHTRAVESRPAET